MDPAGARSRETALPAWFAVPSASAAASPEVPPLLPFGTGFIDRKIAPIQGICIQFFDSLLSGFIRTHLDESKAPRSSCVEIPHHSNRLNASILFKQLPQIRFSHRERKIPDEQFSTHDQAPSVPESTQALCPYDSPGFDAMDCGSV
jgi:hypothetical protein